MNVAVMTAMIVAVVTDLLAVMIIVKETTEVMKDVVVTTEETTVEIAVITHPERTVAVKKSVWHRKEINSSNSLDFILYNSALSLIST